MTANTQSQHWKLLVAGGVLSVLVAAIAAHWAGLGAPFQFDDDRDIVYRQAVSQGPLEAARSSPYRALTYASYALDWKLGHGNPRAFHVTNLALHVLACVLFLFVLRRLMRPLNAFESAAVFTGAAAFASHPLLGASVDYISGRAGVLSAIGGFLMIWIWLGKEFRARWAVLAVVEAIALFGKEDAVAFPVILGAFCLIEEKRLAEVAPSLAVAAAYGAARVFTHPVVVSEPGHGVSLVSHLLIQPYVYCRAALAWLWPVGLSVDHHIGPISGALDIRLWLCGGVVLAAALFAVCLARRGRVLAGMSAAWFIFALAPGAVVPLADPLVENRWYFAAAGLAAGSACAARWMSSRKKSLFVVVAIFWLACLLAAAVHRSRQWASPSALWAESVKLYPSAARPWANYAQARLRQARPTDAVFAARKALSIERDDAVSWNTLGLALKEMGRYDDAVQAYNKAILCNDRLSVAYLNRANILAATGRLDEADADYRRAYRLAPGNVNVRYGLAWVLARKGRKEEALRHLEFILKVKPDDRDARQLYEELVTNN